MEGKIIAVIGATGAQGGGLVRAALNDKAGGLRVRAITRNPGSDKARALAALGAQIVAADVDDAKSLGAALDGAHGAYFVTNFWEHFSPEKELAQARNMAQAAKSVGLRHAVWSTLEDTRKWYPLSDSRMPTLMEKYKVPHFDAKGESDRFFAEAGVPTTYLLTSFYWDNLIAFGMGPKPRPDGKLAFALPMGNARLSGIAAEDIGKCAYGLLKQGTPWIGKTVGIAGEHLTGAQMAAELAKALGREVRYEAIPFDVYRKLGFPGAEDLGNMFQFYVEYGDYFFGSRDLAVARSLNPELQSFAGWLAKNAARIPLA
jgi:uncharacterized protein YbjT (DUF2867 family)